LCLLCKEGLSKDVIEEYHEHIKSVNKYVIGAILQADVGLKLLRRELRRVSPGISVDTDEIQAIILSDVLKREVVEEKLADGARVQVKKAAGRTLVKRKPKPIQE
ncbi:MAG: hypothetical protein WBG94_06155, partial [Anaerolineales bacterium]